MGMGRLGDVELLCANLLLVRLGAMLCEMCSKLTENCGGRPWVVSWISNASIDMPGQQEGDAMAPDINPSLPLHESYLSSPEIPSRPFKPSSLPPPSPTPPPPHLH